MDQLEQIKQKIDSILEKRKESRAKLAVTVEKICELEIATKKAIDDLAKLDHEKRDYYLSELNKVLGQIRAIKETSAPLQKRFNRDTVNLGVAGATQAGKSTLLQAISGLSENELPTAQDGDPTTAARSILINNPTNVATVKFRTKVEFVAFVNGFLRKLGKFVSDVSEFGRLDISSLYCSDAEIVDDLRRLEEIQKIIKSHDFEGLYGTIVDIPFNQITNYVSYSKGKDVSSCFWPVVKIVEIRCNFEAINKGDIKLALVDLPGMGERDEVDKQMVDGLEEEVDNVLLLFKTTAVQPQRDLKTFNAILNAQKDIKDKTKFLSFFINIQQIENKEIQNGQIRSIETRIQENFKRISGNFTTYETDAFNEKQKVSSDLIDVLQRLADNLSELDCDLLSAWEESLNFDSVKQALVDFSNQIKNDMPCSDSDRKKLSHKKNAIKLNFKANFTDLEREYKPYVKVKKVDEQTKTEKMVEEYSQFTKDVRRRISSFVNQISVKIEANPLNITDEEWSKTFMVRKKGAEINGFIEAEMNRLWTYIRNEYRVIEKYANEFLVELKDDIIVTFNKCLESKNAFIQRGGEFGVFEFLDKIKATEISMPIFEKPFETLLKESISFNQIVYPHIVETKLGNMFSTDGGSDTATKDFLSPEGTPEEEEGAFIKQKLINLVLSANGEMASVVFDKCPITLVSFLFAKVEFFNDYLNRSTYSADEIDDCFDDFCEVFRFELWPELFGDSSNRVAVKQLVADLNSIHKLFNNLKK